MVPSGSSPGDKRNSYRFSSKRCLAALIRAFQNGPRMPLLFCGHVNVKCFSAASRHSSLWQSHPWSHLRSTSLCSENHKHCLALPTSLFRSVLPPRTAVCGRRSATAWILELFLSGGAEARQVHERVHRDDFWRKNSQVPHLSNDKHPVLKHACDTRRHCQNAIKRADWM